MSERKDAWEYVAALVSVHFVAKDAAPGVEGAEPSVEPKWRAPILMGKDTSRDEQLAFYKALLEIPWLPPGARSAFAAKLGLPLQKHNTKIQDAQTVTWFLMFTEIKTRMRENGERPRGGIDAAALAELAEETGEEVSTVTQAFYRFSHPEQEQRRKERAAEKRRRERPGN
jgi:hypothetical protein